MIVFAISGHAQNGKDTIAGYICEYLKDKRVLTIHYADLLKHICKSYFGWNGEKDEYGRSLLQKIGTDVVRTKDKNFWVDYLKKFLEVFEDSFDYAVIPDCRFKNEIELLKSDEKLRTIHIKVVRSGFISCLTDNQKSHPSETDLDNYTPDYIINNSGDLDDLRTMTNILIKEITDEIIE